MPIISGDARARRMLGAGLAVTAFSVAALLAEAPRARAVPAFAVQTGQPCQACHVGGFGPQLTPYGRAFKLGGYTDRANKWNVPLSAMLVASYARTAKHQESPPADGFKLNDNVGVDQISLFLAGGLGTHFGGLVQGTWDGINDHFTWDNLDLRSVVRAKIANKPAVLGLSVNNNPTVQDAWNTLPAWGYPYTSSSLVPGPSAAPLFNGGLAQEVLGLTAYAWIDRSAYFEVGGYKTLGQKTLRDLGADPIGAGSIDGVAPYWRLVYQKNGASSTASLGITGMHTSLFPGRDQTTGLHDHYDDVALDATYQKTFRNNDVFSINSRYTYESQRLAASYALGNAEHRNGELHDLRADLSYYLHNQIGGTVGAFYTFGSHDALLYGFGTHSLADSSGLVFQIDGTPWGRGASPLGPRFNARAGLQYYVFTQIDGAATNYDGTGRNAADNNTLRAFIWLAY